MPHIHSIYDTDLHFIIDPITRKITSESGKVTLMQTDHNSERFTFEIPRYIEGHDMSLTDAAQIHYNNIETAVPKRQNKDVYPAVDLQVSPDSDDVVIFSWLISGNATQYVGSLNFIIRFVCYENETDIAYQWWSDTYSQIKIAATMDNSGEVVDLDNTDLLETWRRDCIQSVFESEAYKTFEEQGQSYVDQAREYAEQAKDIVGGDFITNEDFNAAITQFNGSEYLATSVLEKATTVSIGVHHFRLQGDSYTGTDLPASNYRYGNATVFKRTDKAVTVVLWGASSSRAIAKNDYNGKWSGWQIYVSTADLDTKLAAYLPATGGVAQEFAVGYNDFIGESGLKLVDESGEVVGYLGLTDSGFIRLNPDGEVWNIVDAENFADYITPEGIGASPTDHTHTKSEIADFPSSMTPTAHAHAVADITGTLPIDKGGTGATTAAAARSALGLGGAATYGATQAVTSGSTALVTSGAVHSAVSGKANTSHNQAASTITAGTFAGQVKANVTAQATLTTAQLRDIALVAEASAPAEGSAADTSKYPEGTVLFIY